MPAWACCREGGRLSIQDAGLADATWPS